MVGEKMIQWERTEKGYKIVQLEEDAPDYLQGEMKHSKSGWLIWVYLNSNMIIDTLIIGPEYKPPIDTINGQIKDYLLAKSVDLLIMAQSL
jgi:hypothetical protein